MRFPQKFLSKTLQTNVLWPLDCLLSEKTIVVIEGSSSRSYASHKVVTLQQGESAQRTIHVYNLQ